MDPMTTNQAPAPPSVKITETESAALLRLTETNGEILTLSWGTGRIPIVDGNRWALIQLLEWRK